MGFVPVNRWFATRVDRAKLLVGVTLCFIACIELFASAVGADVPFVGVALAPEEVTRLRPDPL